MIASLCVNDPTILDYALFKAFTGTLVNQTPRMLKGPVTGIGELKPGQEVFKTGRTTNDTRGRIGEYRAFTFRCDGFEYNSERYLELTWGYCHTIHRIKEIDPWFAAPGDTGASAID